VTNIGERAFAECSRLTTITISSSVTSIGKFAFSGCSKLISITIPKSVTNIGEAVFSGCSNLTSIKVEEDVKELATIKLVVQPIVENAICHAMEFMEDDGELEVHAYREGDDLYISVKDNGMGMSEEQKEALLKKPVESKRGNGIGVYNVNERIRLYFGAEYGVIINSEPDEGTEVLLHMPAVKYEENVE
jgi:LytS/YehU family sensor histidine kinase